MSNKLAGQRAKYTKALADYNRTDDDAQRANAVRKMAEVLADAPVNGFSEFDVTSDQAVPDDVRRLRSQELPAAPVQDEDPDLQVRQLNQMVDTSDVIEVGSGEKAVYAYGYRCAPDRLKIGRSDVDVVRRVAQQIATGTPDKPSLFLVVRTDNARALEMLLHGTLQLRGRKILGGGDEWYVTSRQELIQIYGTALPSSAP